MRLLDMISGRMLRSAAEMHTMISWYYWGFGPGTENGAELDRSGKNA